MKINPLNFLQKVLNNKAKIDETNNVNKKDTVNISEEAKYMAEVNKYKEVLKKIPDVRTEKIEEIKQKLKDGSYMSKEVYNAVADKMLSDFLEL
ncbi:MAG TPA: flagellar biosynthesis anti-sigma factor FlgM [Spirochaetia bacterium]|nr:MAG: flagellar biosynthesis anti-sigma factor FlgM [Spirochaetes bacterium GWB1_36_13]HCL56433.1 flagellar biosynthesis anti-sigma factor FlgM [Spirochaetia bacterium]